MDINNLTINITLATPTRSAADITDNIQTELAQDVVNGILRAISEINDLMGVCESDDCDDDCDDERIIDTRTYADLINTGEDRYPLVWLKASTVAVAGGHTTFTGMSGVEASLDRMVERGWVKTKVGKHGTQLYSAA